MALSFAAALLTSYTAADLATRITANTRSVRWAWMVGGAFAMGSGIWCSHYIGMLAFNMHMPIFYDASMVGLSLLAAIGSSFVALFVVSQRHLNLAGAALGGLPMGAGIASMHYIGMAAMRMGAKASFDVPLILLSALLAVAASMGGLLLIFRFRETPDPRMGKLLPTLVLGLAIPVMHYIGIAAVTFKASAPPTDLSHAVGISEVANLAIFFLIAVILAFALITSVIDKRISRQQLVLESERKMLRALIDHIPDCMYVKDYEGRFILANQRLATTLGVADADMLIGKTDFDYYPLELATKFRDDEQSIMLQGVSLFEHEETGMSRETGPIPMLTTKVLLRDHNGAVVGIAGVGRDISERKKHEQALLSAERRYRSMFDEALVGLFELDREGRAIHANPAMAEFMGYQSAGQMLGAAHAPIWSAGASSGRRQELIAELETKDHVKSFEMEMVKVTGQKISISTSIRARYAQGERIGYVGIFEDITSRQLLQDQLLQAQKLESVGQLAAGIAHEINTPVQYIGDNVRFLKETFEELFTLNEEYARLLRAAQHEDVTPRMLAEVVDAVRNVDTGYLFEEIPKAIDQTLEGVTRVANLVAAMKEFSHPGTGAKVPLDLNRAIESTVTMSRNEWKYVADLKMELDVALPEVLCLPGEFSQVVLNLIVNAAHAIADVAQAGGRSRGLITVATRSLEDQVEVRVSDTGNGIPQKVQSRIFDPFFTTKEIGKGTGQGLAIARSVVVDKHQGTIAFETEEGSGTTFTILLPCPGATLVEPSLVTA